MSEHTTFLSTEREQEIRERAAAATPGPWGLYDDGTGRYDIAADLEDTGHGFRCRRQIVQTLDEPIDNDPAHRDWTGEEDDDQIAADAEFIAHAREDVPALLAEVDRLRAQIAELEAQRDKLVRWHEEDAAELRRLYAVVPPAAASRRCVLHGSSCDGDMGQEHIMQPARRADGAPLLDPGSFDRPGQRAAARMLNDDAAERGER